MKLMCNKPTIKTLYGEKLKIFFLFNILEVLAWSIGQEKEKKKSSKSKK